MKIPGSVGTNISVGVILIALIAGITVWAKSRPDPSAANPPPVVAPLAAVEAPPEIEQPPVQVANPFDKSEVFEFPAGTTDAQARDAVADMLMKRAMERQDQLNLRRAAHKRQNMVASTK
jgi:hypothetical protein